MRTWVIGILTAGTLLTAAIPAAAQTRPHVSGSETSRSTGPTCVVNGDASSCGESSPGSIMTAAAAPIIVGVSPIMIPVLGGDSSSRAATDTDVSRSTRNGSALAR